VRSKESDESNEESDFSCDSHSPKLFMEFDNILLNLLMQLIISKMYQTILYHVTYEYVIIW